MMGLWICALHVSQHQLWKKFGTPGLTNPRKLQTYYIYSWIWFQNESIKHLVFPGGKWWKWATQKHWKHWDIEKSHPLRYFHQLEDPWAPHVKSHDQLKGAVWEFLAIHRSDVPSKWKGITPEYQTTWIQVKLHRTTMGQDDSACLSIEASGKAAMIASFLTCWCR